MMKKKLLVFLIVFFSTTFNSFSIEPDIFVQLPMFFVRPAKWKKYFNLINSQKDASRTRAIEIFPYFSTQLSKKKDSNKADAILIASFYHETYQKDD